MRNYTPPKPLKQTFTKNGRWISTVHLGSMSHGHNPYETMNFRSKENLTENFCHRTNKEHEAIMIHDIQVAKENFLRGKKW